ncbi:hypothetical protein EON63_21925 [archaeon]|nr:MAG: hypothetical protein EON63_21925 [archaeon]
MMQQRKLGPNGALVYCMEEVLRNSHWLTDTLRSHQGFQMQPYIIIDCPGQVCCMVYDVRWCIVDSVWCRMCGIR